MINMPFEKMIINSRGFEVEISERSSVLNKQLKMHGGAT
jgi:hypothetical protein